MTDILLRRRQNNPLLTGEAGVGKTAVVEGFALAIAQGSAARAAEVRLLALDVGALLAGASMKASLNRVWKGLLEEAGARRSRLFCLSMKFTLWWARAAHPARAMPLTC